jgi:hypothetical protein
LGDTLKSVEATPRGFIGVDGTAEGSEDAGSSRTETLTRPFRLRNGFLGGTTECTFRSPAHLDVK